MQQVRSAPGCSSLEAMVTPWSVWPGDADLRRRGPPRGLEAVGGGAILYLRFRTREGLRNAR